MMDLMMWLLFISASHGSFRSGKVDHSKKIESSIPHVVGLTEEILATDEATVFSY